MGTRASENTLSSCSLTLTGETLPLSRARAGRSSLYRPAYVIYASELTFVRRVRRFLPPKAPDVPFVDSLIFVLILRLFSCLSGFSEFERPEKTRYFQPGLRTKIVFFRFTFHLFVYFIFNISWYFCFYILWLFKTSFSNDKTGKFCSLKKKPSNLPTTFRFWAKPKMLWLYNYAF